MSSQGLPDKDTFGGSGTRYSLVASCGHASQPLGSVVVARNSQQTLRHSSSGSGIANWPLPPQGDSCYEV